MTVCILNEKKVPLKGQTIVLIFGTSIVKEMKRLFSQFLKLLSMNYKMS